MKKLTKNMLLVFIILIAILALTACTSVSDPNAVVENNAPAVEEEVNTESNTEANATEEEVVEEVVEEIVMAEALNVSFAMGNNLRTLTYNQATPLELPDGTVITQGDLKPSWQYFESQLGIDITDITIQDQRASDMLDLASTTGFSDAVAYGGQGIAEALMSYGAQGYFVNLNDYMDQLPNAAAYLEANPNIAKAITAYDGGIYHLPYTAEIGSYARVFHGRESWVIALLDSADALVAETHTLTPAYEGYWDRQATNVVDLQNEAAAGTLTRDVALEALLAYIAETYPELDNPSDLYLGETAVYDIDELVALWRVVELSPNTLSKLATGAVVEGAEISPFFARKASYREEVLRLNVFFGNRVYGSDSYGARFYLDADGVLQFSYAQDDFLAGVDQLADIYAEGLIFSEFADLSVKDDFRKTLYTRDAEEGQMQFGFMTFDWIASTTASNEDVVSMLPPMTKMGSDEFIHFVENTRVIKPDGWAISTASTPEEINAALYMFDFFFSEEGHVAQIYGPPYSRAEGEVYSAPDGTDYPKFAQWTLDTACEMKSCDVSGFLRDFMGSLIPVGYQKEIGFELQYTKNNGPAGWELYIGMDVLSSSYGSEDPLFRLVPPVFSLTEQDTAKLATLAVGDAQVDQLFLYITGADTAAENAEALKALYVEAGVEDYVEVYRNAFARMTAE
jgi:hypothetical protein